MDLLSLIPLSIDYKDQIMDYRYECLSKYGCIPGAFGLKRYESFDDWFNFVKNMPLNVYRPSKQFLGIRLDDNKLVGMLEYRYGFSNWDEFPYGHVGYSILPSEQNKGYCTTLFSYMLEVCKENNEDIIMMTCNEDNIASRKVILKSGGIFYDKIIEFENNRKVGIERYLIPLE